MVGKLISKSEDAIKALFSIKTQDDFCFCLCTNKLIIGLQGIGIQQGCLVLKKVSHQYLIFFLSLMIKSTFCVNVLLTTKAKKLLAM